MYVYISLCSYSYIFLCWTLLRSPLGSIVSSYIKYAALHILMLHVIGYKLFLLRVKTVRAGWENFVFTEQVDENVYKTG